MPLPRTLCLLPGLPARSSLARLVAGVVAGLLLGLAASPALAQAWPSRTIRLVVPFAPGGTTDGVARIVAEKAGELLGQPMLVDNRAGGGGNVGTDLVAKSRPDGYTLAMVGNSFTVNPALFRSMPYKQADLQPVVLAGRVPFVLVVNAASPHRSVAELLAHARENPGRVTYASGGNGTIGHLGAHWLADLARVKMTHVPYKGGSAAMTDLLGGQVDIFFDTLITSTPQLKAGRIRPLFITTERRSEDWPQVPTVIEAGLPELVMSAWEGIVAPAGTPDDVVQLLNRKVNEALASADVKRKLAALGASPIGGSVRETQKFMDDELRRWGAVVRSSGAKVEE